MEEVQNPAHGTGSVRGVWPRPLVSRPRPSAGWCPAWPKPGGLTFPVGVDSVPACRSGRGTDDAWSVVLRRCWRLPVRALCLISNSVPSVPAEAGRSGSLFQRGCCSGAEALLRASMLARSARRSGRGQSVRAVRGSFPPRPARPKSVWVGVPVQARDSVSGSLGRPFPQVCARGRRSSLGAG
jgi:hypothetical protein